VAPLNVATIITLLGTALDRNRAVSDGGCGSCHYCDRFALTARQSPFPASWPVYDLAAIPAPASVRPARRYLCHPGATGLPGAPRRAYHRPADRTHDDTAAITPADPIPAPTRRSPARYCSPLLTARPAPVPRGVIHAAAPAATAPTQPPPRPARRPRPGGRRRTRLRVRHLRGTIRPRDARVGGPGSVQHVGIYIGGINRACGDGNLSRRGYAA